MLHELVVSNLGVIESASVLFGPGLTALTGETGAGKTLVTEAINLLAGGRADPMLVRPGADEAVVEGRFVLADETEVTVRRVVPASGRSRAYLDGSMATAGALAEAVGPLIEVHGQHGHQTLLQAAARRMALDTIAGIDARKLSEIRADVRKAMSELDGLGGDEMARTREIDLLKFQIEEIDEVGISGADEDDALTQRESLLGDAEAHRAAGDKALEILSADGEAGAAIADALAALRERVPYEQASARLYGLQAELIDMVEELRDQVSVIAEDPEALAQVQRRREQLTGLRRKYGKSLAEVLAFHAEASARLDELEHHGERAAALQVELDALGEAESVESARLLAARSKAAPKVAKRVVAELRKLALPNADVDVTVDGPAGGDIDFAVSMNPGAPLLPLAKVASGGELSRVMLALQLVLGADTGTVIYDEVDAGVGGEAATSIGRALAGVGDEHQVIVVTHLPQVAACADHQVNIVKSVRGKATVTELHQLDRDGRVVELARMLAGSPDSDNARAHAAELLAAAAQ